MRNGRPSASVPVDNRTSAAIGCAKIGQRQSIKARQYSVLSSDSCTPIVGQCATDWRPVTISGFEQLPEATARTLVVVLVVFVVIVAQPVSVSANKCPPQLETGARCDGEAARELCGEPWKPLLQLYDICLGVACSRLAS